MDHATIKAAIDRLSHHICADGHSEIKKIMKAMGYEEPVPLPTEALAHAKSVLAEQEEERLTEESIQTVLDVIEKAGPNEVYYTGDGSYVVFYKYNSRLAFRYNVEDLNDISFILDNHANPDGYVTDFKKNLKCKKSDANYKEQIIEEYGMFGITYKFNYAV